MEWKVADTIFSTAETLQILKVTAARNLKFPIWIKSNLKVPLGCMLTPVIDGYIVNHDKGYFSLKLCHLASACGKTLK